MSTALLFAVSLSLIVAAAELFTNAVEWAGFRLRLASGATGSLLAALGTSLPETIVPLVALVTHAPDANAVAIGSVLGAPFLLLTLGIAIIGAAVLGRRTAPILSADAGQARRDLGVFLAAFGIAVAAAAAPRTLRIILGLGLLAVYAGYVRATLGGGAPAEETPAPLHLVRWRERDPNPRHIVIQLVLAVAMLIGGSELFVRALDDAAVALHLDALTLALVLVPAATQLPETLNSILWIHSGDDPLALGNITGSATFQACVLGCIGLTLTSWSLSRAGLIGAGLTIATGLALLVLLRNGRSTPAPLIAAAVPWAGYVAAEISGVLR